MKTKKKLLIWIVVGLAVAIVCIFSFLFIQKIFARAIFYTPPPIEFSQEAWDAYPYDRGPMVQDLLEKYDFLSMTKDEVIELLGENNLQSSNDTLRYGTGGGFGGDEILQFRIDENGRVFRVGIVN